MYRMGFVLAKFRKEKSTEAVLEQLQMQIQALEKYMIITEERKRWFVTNFMGFTIGAYILGFGLCSFFYFPPTMKECFMLLLILIVIVFMRRLLTWYFQRKLNICGNKLTQLKKEKRLLLEQVMDKETYKVALNLLERFGEKKQQQQQQLQRSLAPNTSVYNNTNTNLSSSVISSHSPQIHAVQHLRRSTPYPIVEERSRTTLDRIVDLIVGDSPQKRSGMICKECHAPNGMLPKEELEYVSFRCAFCHVLNQAKNVRPVAPRLSPEAATPAESLESKASEDDGVDKQPSVQRVLLQDVPSNQGDLEATTVTEDLEAEKETVTAEALKAERET